MEETIKTTVIVDTNKAQQDIIKYAAIASDSTKELEERVEAKNKQVKIQNDLSKQTIQGLEKEVKRLKASEASVKEIEKAEEKLNKARLQSLRLQVNGEKQQAKLTQAYANSKNAIKGLDDATGGLLGKMKAFITNPIGIVITALVGLFSLFKKAMNSTEEGASTLNSIFAMFGQIMDNVVSVISDALQPIFKWLADFLANHLGSAFGVVSGAVKIAGEVFSVLGGILKLTLIPFKAIIAVAKAAALAITGDFSGAKKVMSDFKDEAAEAAKEFGSTFKEAVIGVGDAVVDVVDGFKNGTSAANDLIKKAKEIEERQLALNKAKREEAIIDANLGVEARKSLALSKDKSKSDKERETALKRYFELEKKRDSIASKSLDSEIKLLKDRQSLSGNTQKDNEELNKLIIKQINLKEELAKKEGKFNSMMGEFVSARIAAEKKALDTTFEIENIKLLARQKNGEDILSEQINLLQKQRDSELNNLELTEKDKELLTLKYNQKILDIRSNSSKKDIEAQLNIDKISIKQRKANGENVLDLEAEIREREKQQELSNTELTQQERLAIILKYDNEEFILKEEAKKREEEVQLELDQLAYEKRQLELEDEYIKIEEDLAIQLGFLERQKQQELDNTELTKSERLAIESRYANETLALEKSVADAKKAYTKSTLDNFIGAAGEAFGIQKELAVAQMIMKAPEAIGNSFAKAASTYAPPLSLVMGALGAATTVIPIIKGLSDIKKTRFPGAKGKGAKSGGGGSISTSAISGAKAMPTPTAVSDISSNNAARLGVDPNIGAAASATAANNVSGSTQSNVVFSENKYSSFQNQVKFKEERTTI